MAMYPYQWTWDFRAEYFYVTLGEDPNVVLAPDAEKLKQKAREEVVKRLGEEFLAQGHPILIEAVVTDITWERWGLVGRDLVAYRAIGKSRTAFSTDVPHGSPVDPLILLIIAKVLPLIITAIIVYLTLTKLETIASIVVERPIQEFKCGVCGAVFGTAGELDAHKLSAHGITSYTCPYCGAAFSSEEARDEHIKSRHPSGAIIPWTTIFGIVIGGIIVYAVLSALRAREMRR